MSEVNNKDKALPDAIGDEQQLAKYDFYLEMLDKAKKVKADEDNFGAAFCGIAAVREIKLDLVNPITLQQLIFKFNSELRDLEKRRKPQEELRKSLDQLVELIEDTDSVIKQYTLDKIPPNYLDKGARIINGLTVPPKDYYGQKFSNLRLLEIYAALHSMIHYKAPK